MSKEQFKLVPAKPYPALILEGESKKTLIVADLHIGWEVSLAEEGVHIPSQTPKLLGKLLTIIEDNKPDSLLILGDVKHAVAKIEMEEWRDVPNFFEEVLRKVGDVKVILGNHDGNLEPLLPEGVDVVSPRGLILGDVGLFHGHTWPRPEMMGCRILVIGHVHPVVTFRDPTGFRITRQVWVRAECDGRSLTRLLLKRIGAKLGKEPPKLLENLRKTRPEVTHIVIMPSFNEFLGGQAVNRRRIGREDKFREFIGPVLRSGSVNLESAEVYLLDGTFLGTIKQLRTLF
ncbi:MAG: phosphoesterase [Candidatus Bathyarchaeota archaeon B26-1]|nr:MAG: phosphoesterase [Candidatus Bathyarchaeota archaeon B26-1]